MAAGTNQMCWKQRGRAVTAAGTAWQIKTASKTEGKWEPDLPVWIYVRQLFYPVRLLLHLSKCTQNSPSLMTFLPSPLMTQNSGPSHASISLCSISSELALFHLFSCVHSWGFTSQHQLEPEDTAEQMVELLLAQPCCCPVAFCFCTRQWLPAYQLWMWRPDLGQSKPCFLVNFLGKKILPLCSSMW